MDVGNLIPRVEQLWKGEAIPSWQRLLAAYPSVPDADTRRSIAFLIKGVASSTYLALLHLHENLCTPVWWEAHGFSIPKPLPPVPNELRAFDWWISAGLVMFPFVHLETGLRRIVRALDSTACSGGASEFKGVYDWLFARLRASGWQYAEGTEFLDLYRGVRNSIHNSGVYFHPQGRNQEVHWKGKKYSFEMGKALGFMDWNFDLMLVSELIRLNESIMTSTVVAALPSIP